MMIARLSQVYQLVPEGAPCLACTPRSSRLAAYTRKHNRLTESSLQFLPVAHTSVFYTELPVRIVLVRLLLQTPLIRVLEPFCLDPTLCIGISMQCDEEVVLPGAGALCTYKLAITCDAVPKEQNVNCVVSKRAACPHKKPHGNDEMGPS